MNLRVKIATILNDYSMHLTLDEISNITNKILEVYKEAEKEFIDQEAYERGYK